ncbi:MAG: hypothetical protein PVI53_12505 [Desulfobacteraceae bacterium]|jgi:hypothetical protein
MNLKRHLYIGLITAILTAVGLGFATKNRYGRVTVERNMPTIEQLSKNWENYYVYASYLSATQSRPYAIMFDPKDDDRKLKVHESWSRVKDKKQLLTLIAMLRTSQFLVDMWVIHGPDKRTYGYMYTSCQDVIIRVVDEKTLWLDRLWPSAYDLRL